MMLPPLETISEKPGPPASSAQLPDIVYPVPPAELGEVGDDGRSVQFRSHTSERRFMIATNDSGSPPRVRRPQVEVLSKSERKWFPGYVERFVGEEVVIAFQLPDAEASDWAKKQLPIKSDELRWIDGVPDRQAVALWTNPSTSSSTNGYHRPAPVSGCQDTEAPANWTAEELATYDGFFQELASAQILEALSLADYLQKSQLSNPVWNGELELQQVITEVLQVSNPDLKQEFGIDEVRSCCRLMSHCAAMAQREELTKLRKKRGALRTELRSRCLLAPPPTLAAFGPCLGA